MSKTLLAFFLIGLSLVTTSCVNTAVERTPRSDILHLEGPELKAAQFESGRPRIGEDLDQSVQHPEITLQLMRDNLGLLKRLPSEKFKIIGSTDDRECAGDECIQLSQRRASALIDWLIRQGLPASMLIPEARGPYMGLAGPHTERNRRISRRADIQIVVTEGDQEK
ncbi:OmpA family protein [Lysobacter sp. CA199]|uniref:OmpA family protein n=1 Tax=Lysobacter sp. CA199 TaxID=3455608 RepID=UPI003F8D0F3C